MVMKLFRSTTICAPAERVWSELQTPRLLVHVARPFVRFVPVSPPQFPEVWEDAEYEVKVWAFGVVPFGRQTIRTSRSAEDGNVHVLRDRGSGQLVKVWDHIIRVQPAADGTTRYSDAVEVKAGLLTPFVWLFAYFFYWHRQRRWRALARGAFSYHAR